MVQARFLSISFLWLPMETLCGSEREPFCTSQEMCSRWSRGPKVRIVRPRVNLLRSSESIVVLPAGQLKLSRRCTERGDGQAGDGRFDPGALLPPRPRHALDFLDLLKLASKQKARRRDRWAFLRPGAPGCQGPEHPRLPGLVREARHSALLWVQNFCACRGPTSSATLALQPEWRATRRQVSLGPSR